MQTLSHSQAHTQGPWSCVPGKFFIVYSYVDDEPIAVPKTEANAALIAAAPGLLEALIRLSNAALARDASSGDPIRVMQTRAELFEAMKAAEPAIAKATGGAA